LPLFWTAFAERNGGNHRARKRELHMEKDFQGYHIDGEFPEGFSSVIESWFAVIHDYEEKTRFGRESGASIYWYSERTNVGAFAAALSRNNITVIEEYACKKVIEGKEIQGRADISFFYEHQWYLAEAKMHWEMLSSQLQYSFDEKVLENSISDAACSWEGDKNTIPLGLTFIVPAFPASNKDAVTTSVQAFIDQFEKVNPRGFWAYCAPARLRYLQSSRGGRAFYPLVIMVGQKNLCCQKPTRAVACGAAQG